MTFGSSDVMSLGRHTVIRTSSHLDDLALGRISSGWLMAHVVGHPDDIPYYPMSSGWQNEIWVSHPDDLLGVISDPDVLRQIYYVVRITYAPHLSHLDKITHFKFSQFAVALQHFWSFVVRKRWRATTCCEKSKFAISSGWLKNGSVCHLDDMITLS